MKAVFIARGCLLRGASEGLSEAARAAMQALAERGTYTVLLGTGPDDDQGAGHPADGELNQRVIDMVHAANGRIDAMVHCPHGEGEACYCWGTYPGFLWEAARDLDIHLDESHILCDSPTDVQMAYAAGCRPILVLGGRTIESIYGGFQPEPADFPIARDLIRAVEYIACEDEITAEWGYPHPVTASLSLEDADGQGGYRGDWAPELLPTVTAFSVSPAKEKQRVPQVVRYGGIWLLLFIVGGVWLSLGIAYLLTHLYRVQPFPEFVWYLTLQFIPRPVRGALFILTGALALWLAIRSVRGRSPIAVRWGKMGEQKRTR